MNSAEALLNGSFSANHRGSVWPCGLTIGRSLTLAYRARASSRWRGSDENSRSGWRTRGRDMPSILGAMSHARDGARSALDMQLLDPCDDFSSEMRIGRQILAENRPQAEEAPRQRLRIATMRRGDAGKFGRER